MTFAELTAFCLYAFVTSITPGPNNAMLANSGVNFGFYRSLPHALGVSCGLCLMILGVGLGLEGVFARYPAVFSLIKVAGAGYLVYLAWRIASTGAPRAGGPRPTIPLGYWGAVLFQWLNPKTWLMAVGAITVYAPHNPQLGDMVFIAMTFTLINVPCVSAWAAGGSLLKASLAQEQRLRLFNRLMAGALLLSIYPVLIR